MTAGRDKNKTNKTNNTSCTAHRNDWRVVKSTRHTDKSLWIWLGVYGFGLSSFRVVSNLTTRRDTAMCHDTFLAGSSSSSGLLCMASSLCMGCWFLLLAFFPCPRRQVFWYGMDTALVPWALRLLCTERYNLYRWAFVVLGLLKSGGRSSVRCEIWTELPVRDIIT